MQLGAQTVLRRVGKAAAQSGIFQPHGSRDRLAPEDVIASMTIGRDSQEELNKVRGTQRLHTRPILRRETGKYVMQRGICRYTEIRVLVGMIAQAGKAQGVLKLSELLDIDRAQQDLRSAAANRVIGPKPFSLGEVLPCLFHMRDLRMGCG